MIDSFDISYSFYEQLGPERLAARTTADWDAQIVAQLLAMLRPGQHVLDVGCGYGRTALPLAESGYRVVGLDISERLLDAHREQARQRTTPVDLIRASMCCMPFLSCTFHVALCLWSAFYELLTIEEQLAAIEEVLRVLQPGGWFLMEGSVYEFSEPSGMLLGDFGSAEKRLVQNTIEGLANPHYGHDAETLTSLMCKAGISEFSVYVENWAGRPRRFLRFTKPG